MVSSCCNFDVTSALEWCWFVPLWELSGIAHCSNFDVPWQQLWVRRALHFQHEHLDNSFKALTHFSFFFFNPVSSRAYFWIVDEKFVGPCALLMLWEPWTVLPAVFIEKCSRSWLKVAIGWQLLRETSVKGIIRLKGNAKCNSHFPALLKTNNVQGKNTKQEDYFETQINSCSMICK